MDFYTRADVRADDNIRTERQEYLLSQYAASSTIRSLLYTLRRELAPRPDYLLLYEKIVDVASAEGMGLDIWGRIVAIGRVIKDPKTGVNLTLDDEHYRRLLMYKALSNINESTIPALTTLINILFPKVRGGTVINVENYRQHTDGNYYNARGGIMRIRWVFLDFFDDLDFAVFRAAGQLNRGAGVGWSLYAIDPGQIFGFDEQQLQPFNQGIFDPVGLITE